MYVLVVLCIIYIIIIIICWCWCCNFSLHPFSSEILLKNKWLNVIMQQKYFPTKLCRTTFGTPNLYDLCVCATISNMFLVCLNKSNAITSVTQSVYGYMNVVKWNQLFNNNNNMSMFACILSNCNETFFSMRQVLFKLVMIVGSVMSINFHLKILPK